MGEIGNLDVLPRQAGVDLLARLLQVEEVVVEMVPMGMGQCRLGVIQMTMVSHLQYQTSLLVWWKGWLLAKKQSFSF